MKRPTPKALAPSATIATYQDGHRAATGDTCGLCHGAERINNSASPTRPNYITCPQCFDPYPHCGLHPHEYSLRPSKEIIRNRLDDDGNPSDHGIMTGIRHMIQQSVADPQGFLTLVGEKGTGKTLALKTLTATACSKGTQAWYRADLAGIMDKIMNPNPTIRNHAISGLKRTRILCIDEWCSLTNGQMKEFWVKVLDYRFNHASTKGLLTAFAMNSHADGWIAAKGGFNVGKIDSRMRDGNNDRYWPIAWNPHVPEYAKENFDIVDGQKQYVIPGYIDMLTKPYTITDFRPQQQRAEQCR